MREAIEQSLSAEATTHPTQKSDQIQQSHLQRIHFLRTEQAVSGYGYLDTGASRNQIMLPRHVNGRFASVSPEHSLSHQAATALNLCRWFGRGVVGCR
jgi:hypothetical protein